MTLDVEPDIQATPGDGSVAVDPRGVIMIAAKPMTDSDGSRQRLLIVEDEVALATTLAEGLERDGFLVDVLYDGAMAITYLARHDVELVVLDRDLPGLHGDAICRALVTIDHPARVLMLSAAGSPADRVSGLDLGADDYLAKPFEYAELVARLRALGRLRHTSRPTFAHGSPADRRGPGATPTGGGPTSVRRRRP